MTKNFLQKQSVIDVDAILQGTVTAAVTDILTLVAHGYRENDILQFTTTTTLPAGLSLLTDYYVVEITDDTFKVAATPSGVAIDITDTGTGTHTAVLKGKAILVRGYRHVVLGFSATGTANSTTQIQSSTAEELPQFSAAASASNPWAYVQVIGLEDAAAIDGDTGIVVVADVGWAHYEVNTNGMVWLCAQVTAWSAGKVGLTVVGYGNQ